MARRHSKHDPYGHLHSEEEAPAPAVPCWLCGRPTGKAIVWHHPVPKSRGGRDVVPMHPLCQQTLIANFTNSELQRHGMDVEGLQLRLIIPGPARTSDQRLLDPKLIGLMREAHEARRLFLTNPDQPLRRMASNNNRCRNRRTRLIAISCLAPDIVVAILEGRQPLGFLSKTLFEVDLPVAWEDQRRVLGFT